MGDRLWVIVVGLVHTSAQAYAPIQMMRSGMKGLAVLPKGFSGNVRGAVTPQMLTISDRIDSISPTRIPYFSAKSDQTITWDDMDWCLEADGKKRGSMVRVNRCTGSAVQKWRWIPNSQGSNMLQLKDTTMCLDVRSNHDGLNEVPIELRECANHVIETWKFEDRIPFPRQRPFEHIVRFFSIWNAMISSLPLVALGVLSLGVATWRKQERAVAVDHGVSMIAALTSDSNRKTPAEMALNPGSTEKLDCDMAFVETAPGSLHYCLDPESYDAKYLASKIWWFGPKFSPKDVPVFYDVASITEVPECFKKVIDIFVGRYKAMGEAGPTHVLGYDARGFIIGPPIALALGIPFVLFRKGDKNPGVLVESSGYAKEYAEKKLDTMSMRLGGIKPGARVLLVDDLIATGGTALSGFEICLSCGIEVLEFAAVIDLPGCGGVDKIREYASGRFKDTPVFTLVDGRTVPDANCRDPIDWAEKSRVVSAPKAKEMIEKYPKLN